MFPFVAIADLAMVYLLGIVFTTSQAGKGPSFLTTVLSVLAFDFFFVPPRYSLYVNSPGYLVTFAVMFAVGFVMSRLTLRVREQANAARHGERRTAALYSLSRKLVHERGIEHLCAIAIKHISEVFSCRVVVLMPDERGQLTAPVTGPVTFELDQKEMTVAQWTFNHRQKAGHGTDTLSGAKALCLPLVAASRNVGVIAVMPNHPSDFFDQEQVHILESFANQTAMAIDRALLGQEAQLALLKAETEVLRNTLLSSVSHDLRTPLAAITGAATALLQRDIALDQQGRQELVKTIYEEAVHLNEIIRNVLDMTRLETRAIRVKKEWQSIEEIVGVVLNRLSDKIAGRTVTVDIPAELPLVPFDSLLIEQVFINLLDNATKYTPAHTPIDLKAEVREESVFVEIADCGPGIPQGDEEKIFEKFVRGFATSGGIGLGLTICRAIIDAHGGRIWAENRPGGGAIFRFTLPFGGEAPMPELVKEEMEAGDV
jgi:two-component system sensor histidine kinase KdpD